MRRLAIRRDAGRRRRLQDSRRLVGAVGRDADIAADGWRFTAVRAVRAYEVHAGARCEEVVQGHVERDVELREHGTNRLGERQDVMHVHEAKAECFEITNEGRFEIAAFEVRGLEAGLDVAQAQRAIGVARKLEHADTFLLEPRAKRAHVHFHTSAEVVRDHQDRTARRVLDQFSEGRDDDAVA
jgi:hypothetical protein